MQRSNNNRITNKKLASKWQSVLETAWHEALENGNLKNLTHEKKILTKKIQSYNHSKLKYYRTLDLLFLYLQKTDSSITHQCNCWAFMLRTKAIAR